MNATRTPKLLPVQRDVIKLLDRFAANQTQNFIISKKEIALLCRYSATCMEHFDADILPGHEDHIAALNSALENCHVDITLEHEMQGLSYLWSQYGKGWLGNAELALLRRFQRFHFVGIDTKRSGTHRWSATPRFTVVCDHGTFTYAAWSWQSGFKPYVEGR